MINILYNNFTVINLTLSSATIATKINYFSFQYILLAFFLIALSILTIFGNVLVLLALLADFHLRSPSHYLMGSLAMTDLLLGIMN
jgi:hypothetical protein